MHYACFTEKRNTNDNQADKKVPNEFTALRENYWMMGSQGQVDGQETVPIVVSQQSNICKEDAQGMDSVCYDVSDYIANQSRAREEFIEGIADDTRVERKFLNYAASKTKVEEGSLMTQKCDEKCIGPAAVKPGMIDFREIHPKSLDEENGSDMESTSRTDSDCLVNENKVDEKLADHTEFMQRNIKVEHHMQMDVIGKLNDCYDDVSPIVKQESTDGEEDEKIMINVGFGSESENMSGSEGFSA